MDDLVIAYKTFKLKQKEIIRYYSAYLVSLLSTAIPCKAAQVIGSMVIALMLAPKYIFKVLIVVLAIKGLIS